MIESIKEVKVTEISPVQELSRTAANSITYPYGVYLFFYPVEGKDPSSFRARSYCKIGRARGKGGVRQRIIRNIKWHEDNEDECGPVEQHLFQALACESEIDAARLEQLFHLWHGNYPDPGNPTEARHRPKAKMEPDFFVLESE